jgi:hypothetical protein
LQAQKQETHTVLVTIVFVFPLTFVLYSIIFKIFSNLSFQIQISTLFYPSLFSQQYLTLSFKSHYHSNFLLYGITSFPNVSIIFPFYKYLSFFPQISHQILNHLSNFYFIIHFLSSFLARMAKWIETLFLTVITIATVIMTFFCLHSPEKCGPAMVAFPILYMLLIIAWFINRHF